MLDLNFESLCRFFLCLLTNNNWLSRCTENLCQLYVGHSEVPNRRAEWNKQAGLEKNATLLAYLLSKSINKVGGFFCLLHEKLQAGWNENLKNLSKHALLLGTSE